MKFYFEKLVRENFRKGVMCIRCCQLTFILNTSASDLVPYMNWTS